MDFTGKKVVHKVWGEGVVTLHSHPYVKVQFANETKMILFPDAFKEVTVFANSDDQQELHQMIAQHEWENLKKAAYQACHRFCFEAGQRGIAEGTVDRL